MKTLENKVVIITGGAMGLGLATALEVAKKGGHLTLVDYNEKALAEAKASIAKDYPNTKVLTIIANVANEDEVKNYVNETVKPMAVLMDFITMRVLKESKHQ